MYKGICKTTFKRRYTDHKKYFNVEKNKKDTKLSTEHWKLTNKKLQPQIFWNVKGKCKSYSPNSRRRSSCWHKKLDMVDAPDEMLLRKWSEVISQCCHRNKYKLQNNGSSWLQVSTKWLFWTFWKLLEELWSRVYHQ